ncbi:transglutaminase-like cysteine peptidase [Asticcacaulis sp. W401b]|uniref:transglutaminase-like cysteine peptidase n=1 Tax=Asticcacaulis sp. W401b TaxID=3388666 RepID=UPI003970BFC6
MYKHSKHTHCALMPVIAGLALLPALSFAQTDSRFMPRGQVASTPTAYLSFCNRAPEECVQGDAQSPEAVRSKVLNLLSAKVFGPATQTLAPSQIDQASTETPNEAIEQPLYIVDAPTRIHSQPTRYIRWVGKVTRDAETIVDAPNVADLDLQTETRAASDVNVSDEAKDWQLTDKAYVSIEAPAPLLSSEPEGLTTPLPRPDLSVYQAEIQPLAVMAVPHFKDTAFAEAAPQTESARATEWYVDGVPASKRLQPETEVRETLQADEGERMGPGRVHMSPALWRDVDKVNFTVNQVVRPVSDRRQFNKADYWFMPGVTGDAQGDCEDYVLEKRHLLLEKGIPATALSIAIARTPKGEVHAVLILTTLEGDFVLDNLTPRIKPWREVNYAWISRQDPNRPFEWMSVPRV